MISIKPYTIGYIGEIITILFLTLKLHTIIKHRYKCPLGEIDIIAIKKNILIFIEVKTSIIACAGKSITYRQRHTIIKAAKHFTYCYPKFNTYQIRFDACFVSLQHMPIYITNAWCENK
ncbi:YraN family protein [Neoehrlichia mikurensis]|uniref:YraN family protein n=1 Tax=Neoehrlichia mikurensis TaxID=89586 RepID=A0A9Q9BWG7_9RICK|nr:YraN family protein [Neoehrlichia mikurensis]QXK92274.1 YraN family protein [Neoehrlichia mikurensis]QXK92728.1 YraN family protein [Neoehrlichia mikurensis]QXK93968.1 YraN family protein [Neoehrlichia mikurensis]UTO55868.1 YraN family protein [Neoehrlichia mikurensis]UTO56784.1 YraN family protein [Neoehrlichia mikurensis]